MKVHLVDGTYELFRQHFGKTPKQVMVELQIAEAQKKWTPKFGRFLLDSDARIDSSLFHFGRWLREMWERLGNLMSSYDVMAALGKTHA